MTITYIASLYDRRSDGECAYRVERAFSSSREALEAAAALMGKPTVAISPEWDEVDVVSASGYWNRFQVEPYDTKDGVTLPHEVWGRLRATAK